MYRAMPLSVGCIGCGVEASLERMDLAPQGGHWCWRCRTEAQIAEHRRPRSNRDRVFIVTAVVFATMAFMCIVWLAAALHSC
jgi:hypothetical protein